MRHNVLTTLAAVMLTATVLAQPASANSLLGVLGDSESGALITLGSGEAGSSGVVNVGLGGGGGNVLDANVLSGSSGSSLVTANVSSGGSNGLLDVDANVGGAIGANVNVGGSGGLLTVGIGVGGNGGGGNGGGGGGGGGGNGNGGGGNGGGSGGNGNGGTAVASNGGGGAAVCAGTNPSHAWRLFERTSFSGWNRASNIEIVPVQLCPTDRQQISRSIRAEQKFNQLQQAIHSDALIAAALSRSSFGTDRVLGVTRSGSRLTVYVY